MAKKFDLSDPIQCEAYWTGIASKQLLGKKIVHVRYLTQDEKNNLGWFDRPIVIQLDDGNLIYPAQDEEGNGPGAWFTNDEKNPVLPIL